MSTFVKHFTRYLAFSNLVSISFNTQQHLFHDPSPAESTLLHVVYAGRGDAFYLEYTHVSDQGHEEHMLVLLDGGPLTAAVKSTSKSPYYKYYLAAGEHIWQQHFPNPAGLAKFSPNAIINSHPHDDHLDGLLYLLRSQRNGAMLFDGPFILPNQECNGKAEVEEMARSLGFTQSYGCRVPGINFYYPSPSAKNMKILSFSLPAVNTNSALMAAPILPLADRPVIDLPDKISIDTSSENLESILMDVDPESTRGGGRMFFTGDNVGYKIRDYVYRKHFTIYKIQHHGSLRNSQFDKTVATVHVQVAEEAALLAFMRFAFIGASDALFINPPATVSRTSLQDFIKTCFNDVEWNVISLYLGELEKRNVLYLQACINREIDQIVQLAPIPWQTKSEDLKKTRPPARIWAAILQEISKAKPEYGEYHTRTYGPLFYLVPTGVGVETRSFKMQDWATSLLNVKQFHNNFRAILLMGNIFQFFESFTADAYVVSANKMHAHPSAATIAGLAIAVYKKCPFQPVPLYATDGYAIDMDEVTAYVKEMGYDPIEVFNGKFLVIQCLDKGIYMTINGNGGTMAPETGESRDVLRVTKQLLTDPTARMDLKTIHSKFEENRGLLPDRLIDRGITYRYQITAPVQKAITKEIYMMLNPASGAVRLTDTQPANPFVILNSWDWRAPTFEDYLVYQTYTPSKDAWLRVAHRKKIAGMTCWQIGFLDGENIVKFYVREDDNFHKIGWDVDIPRDGSPVYFYLKDVTPAPVTLLSQQPSVITSMVALPPASQSAVLKMTDSTLSEFCVAAGIDTQFPFSALRSLQALVGGKNLYALSVGDGFFEKLFLTYPTNLASAVAFTDNGLDMKVSSASLTLNPPADAVIVIGGEEKKITAVVMTLQWPSTNDLSIVTTVSIEDDMIITKKRKLLATALPISLKKTLATMGVDATTMESLGAPNAIAYLTADQVGLVKLFYDRVPMSLLMAGLMDLKPDLELSTVEAWYDITGLPAVKRAEVVCLTPADTWKSLFNLGGIKIVLGQVRILLEDALLPSQTITMHGTAVFKTTQALDAANVELILSCPLNLDGDVEVNFAISGTDSLDTLSSLLGPDSTLTSAQVPFRNEALRTLASTSQLAMTFTQSTDHIADYRLSRISASTSFSDWKSFLPVEFPIHNLVSITDVGIALDILDPLDSAQRAVRASVTLELKVGSEEATEKIVRLGFTANPLGSFGGHEYRLAAFAADSGLSIAVVAMAIGLTGVTETLTAAGSLVGQLLTEVRIRSLSVSVEKTNDAWKFGDWSLDVRIDNFVIIRDVFSLSDVSVILENSNGLLMGDLSGSIQIALVNLECKLRLPTEPRPGLISINSPNGVSAADIISALKLPDLSVIPILGTLLSTQLDTAHFTVGYLPNQGGGSSLSWLGSSFKFELDQVSVTDSIVINGISVAIGYHSEHDPFGPGETQFVFRLKAGFLDDTLVADIIYDSLAAEIEFALTSPDRTKAAKVADMVGKLLGPSFKYALKPFVGDMAINEASLKLSTAGGIQMQHFKIDISDSVSAEFQGLAMNSLSVEYTAAKVAHGDVLATPEKFVLKGSIQKGQVGARLTIECTSTDSDKPTQVSFVLDAPPGTNLYLSGLVDLFTFSDPSHDKPDQCPDFTGLAIKTIQGKVSVQTDAQTGKSSLSLNSLDAYIESVNKINILENPAVTLESISLHLHFEDNTFSGRVYGHLTIETIDIWAYFNRDSKDRQVFKGKLTLSDQQTPVLLDKLAATFLPNAADYAIPRVLNAPSEIPLYAFGVTLIPNEFIEAWGTGQLPLSLGASGYTVSMTKIGGLVQRFNASDSLLLPDRYSAFLIGELQFDKFTSARASITIGTGQTTMLTASVTSLSSTVDLDGLTAPLSGDRSTLKTISPAGTSDMSFGNSGYLCVDFTNSKLFLFGQLAPPISAYGMIMGKWKPSGPTSDRNYFVAVTTQNLGTIWNDLNAPVLSSFDFSVAGGHIVSWTGTIEALHAELSDFVVAAPYAKVYVTDILSTLLSLTQTDQVPRGGTLFATLDLKGGGVVNKAIVAGLEPTRPPPTLTFYAMLNTADPKKSRFMVSMQNLYLFGGALLFNGTAEYYSEGPRLVALGSMQLTLSPASSVTLQMELKVSENRTSFTLQGRPSGDDTLVNPFGGMFNVQLKEIILDGSICKSGDQTHSDYFLSGSVYLGTGLLRADLDGSIYFSQGKAVTAAVTASLELFPGQQGISVEDIFSNIIQPGDPSSGSWPSGYGTISFQSVIIYYSIHDYQLGEDVFKEGYHIAADIQIFGTLFTITADLENRKGIVIAGQKSKPIQLGFLELTGQTPAPATGPSVIIDTTGSATIYRADVGVKLFDLPQINAMFLYQQGEASLKCIVQYTGTFLGVPDPHVTILYKDDKFTLAEWEMIEDMLEKIDIAKAVIEASESDPSACSKLVGLTFDKAIKTKFSFTLGDASLKDGSLQFNLKWTYDITISIPGASDVHIPGLKLPDLPLTISPPYRLSELDQLLINSIWASIKKIGAVLLEPDNLTQLLTLITVMEAKEWTKDVIQRLLCRQADADNVKKRGEELADEDANEIDNPENSGNKATEAARAVTAATDLATALGALATAVEFGREFAAFLPGVLGFLDTLLNWFADKTKLEQLQKKATDQGQKADSAVQKAKDFIGKVLNLSETPNSPVSNYVSSETHESTIELNWEANKPNWHGFNYGNFENVVWEVKMGLVDNVDDLSMHELTSNTFSLAYADPLFVFGSTVYSYVRARATVLGQTFYSANWARAQPAVHIPWLRPVSKVDFQLTSVSNPYSCVVSVRDAAVGKYRVQVVGKDSSSTTTVLYEANSVFTSAGTMSLNVGIYDFIPVTSNIAALLARVQVVSPDHSTSHDSPYTDSSISTSMVAAPGNLQAVYSQKAVTVSWEQPGSRIDDFDLLVVKADGTLDTAVIVTPIPSADGQRQASLTGLSIIEGASLTIAARSKPRSWASLGLFAFITYEIPLPLTPQIDSESYYNMESRQVRLTLKFASQPPSNLQFVLQLHPTSGSLPDPFTEKPESFSGNTVSIALSLDIAIARATASISVASFDPIAGQRGKFGDPWQFPTIPQSLPACSPSATFTSAGSVQVSLSWDGLTEATTQKVTIILSVPEKTVRLTKTVQRPNNITTFTMDNSENQFTPGQSLRIKCISLAPGVVGGLAEINFTIPGSIGWTPYALVNHAPVGSVSTMTSLSREANSLELWWASTDGSIQMATLENNSWTGSQFIDPSTVSVAGSCLTSTTRGPYHKEVWWVTDSGAIDGRLWRANDGWGSRLPNTGRRDPYPFNQPGQASTKAGGSITCMSRSGSRMDVWWVDPTGAIGNARWNSSDGWGVVFTAAPSSTAGFGNSISGLTAQSLDAQRVDIFYIGEDGSVGGASSSDPDATAPYALYSLTPAGAARLDGGFTSMRLSPKKIALFWISPQDNIEMLVLTKSVSAPSGWDRDQQAFTEPGSAWGASGITTWSTGASRFSVWWNGPQGLYADLRRIDVDLAQGPEKWLVYEQLGVGSCRKTRNILSGSANINQRHLWYVDSAGTIQGMFSTR